MHGLPPRVSLTASIISAKELKQLRDSRRRNKKFQVRRPVNTFGLESATGTAPLDAVGVDHCGGIWHHNVPAVVDIRTATPGLLIQHREPQVFGMPALTVPTQTLEFQEYDCLLGNHSFVTDE